MIERLGRLPVRWREPARQRQAHAHGGEPGRAAAGGRLLAWLVPAVPAALALAANLYHLGVPSLWRDEAYTIEAARRPPGQIFALLQHSDAVHGAYYLCMHVVMSLLGRSATAVRLPSVLATAVAAGFLAVLGRRLAARSGVPLPEAVGVLAGLLYAIAPSATYYAQEARSYAIVTALAVIATYLLDHALAAGGRNWSWPGRAGAGRIITGAPSTERGPTSHPGRWPWCLWAGYAVAVALTGLFNVLGLLILVAHAVTVLVASGRLRTFLSWAGSGIVAAAVLTPVLLLAYAERSSISWEGKPRLRTLSILAAQLAGSKQLVIPMAVLVAISACMGLVTGRRRVNAALVGVPWLVLPPAILLAVSQLHAVYNFRYVVFCLPAVALLASDGLAWIARLIARIARIPAGPGTDLKAAGVWLPSAAIAAILAVALIGPQHGVRKSGSRPDNLRKAAAILSAGEQPGDVVFYLPINSRVLGTAYPGPFRKLRDIALARTPVQSATLNGTEVSAATLASRFAGTTRVWLVTNDGRIIPPARSPADKEKLALLSGFQMIGRWRTGPSSMLTLFARGRAT